MDFTADDIATLEVARDAMLSGQIEAALKLVTLVPHRHHRQCPVCFASPGNPCWWITHPVHDSMHEPRATPIQRITWGHYVVPHRERLDGKKWPRA